VRIHHIALRTNDLTRLEQFYTAVFALEVTRRDGSRSVWLNAGGTILMLERAEVDEPSIPSASMEFLCFGLTPAEVSACVGRLEAANVSVEARTRSTLYFRDPDGRRVGVSAYPAEL
jgi:catechol-2,3-dioxygenase